MPAIVKLWDAEKGDFVDMFAIKAREALKNDSKRYSSEKPEPKAAKADGKKEA